MNADQDLVIIAHQWKTIGVSKNSVHTISSVPERQVFGVHKIIENRVKRELISCGDGPR